MSKSDLEASDRLRGILGACALAFLLGILLLVFGEARGLGPRITGAAMVLLPFALYAAVGLTSPASDVFEFQLAARRVPAAFAGIAAAAAWAPAALLLGAPTSLFLAGYDGRPVLIGLTGGYVLLAVLIGPFLRNMGVRTLPEFMAARFGGFARLLAVLVLVVSSLLFAAALLQAGGPLIGRMLGVDANVGTGMLAAVLLLCTIAGGMASATSTQIAEYAVLLIGSLAVLVIFAARPYDPTAGAPYDALARTIEAVIEGLGLAPASSPRSIPFHVGQAVDDIELAMCLMAGTAALPHVLMHPLATRGMGEARASTAWTLVFIAILAFTLPTYMTLANAAADRELTAVMFGLLAAIPMAALLAGASASLVTVANSLDHDVWARLTRSREATRRRLIIARSLLIVAVLTATAIALHGVALEAYEPARMLAWAFSLAAGGLFPVLVLGIWWTRTTTLGAIAGIISGFGISLVYVILTRYFPQAGITQFGMQPLTEPASGLPLVDAAAVLSQARWLADVPASAANPLASKVGWLNVSNFACGIFGLVTGLAITAGVSLLGSPPSDKKREQLESLRIPQQRDA